jgi:hypothetical protein
VFYVISICRAEQMSRRRSWRPLKQLGQSRHGRESRAGPRGYRIPAGDIIRRQPVDNPRTGRGAPTAQHRMFVVKTWGRMRSETACICSRFVLPKSVRRYCAVSGHGVGQTSREPRWSDGLITGQPGQAPMSSCDVERSLIHSYQCRVPRLRVPKDMPRSISPPLGLELNTLRTGLTAREGE